VTSFTTYFETLRHLRAQQIYRRIWFRLARPRVDMRPEPPRRSPVATFVPPPPKPRSVLGPDLVSFLNEQGSIADANAWTSAHRSKLWLYNLHYFDDLLAADAASRYILHDRLIRRWIEEHPPGRSPGWEPYPTSLRIVNWTMACLLGREVPAVANHSLAVQARWLRRRLEFHLLGNHLLANAKALFVAGSFFTGDEAERWLTLGRTLLEREIEEQILQDGAHFELSPMYHLITLTDLLDVLNVSRAFDLAPPRNAAAAVPRMLHWSRVMRHPDGEIPFFNDAAFGIAPAPGAVDDYADRLGFAAGPKPGDLSDLSASGYARLARGDAVLLLDAAPVGPDYLPAHAHADTLSFELSLFGRRVIVNSGTSVYGGGPERRRQRGTAAHSTVAIEGTDSSEVWGGFRVGRRARILERRIFAEDATLLATAVHDGYRHLPGQPSHRREWRLRAEDLTIRDHISGEGNRTVFVWFHLHPDITVSPIADGRFRLSFMGTESESGFATLVTPPDAAAAVTNSRYHPRFGTDEPASAVLLSVRATGNLVVETRLHWVG